MQIHLAFFIYIFLILDGNMMSEPTGRKDERGITGADCEKTDRRETGNERRAAE